ncbi:gliding motility-associated C-terminal domain-containing protein [Chitinophaga sp. RCC_12]|uniref:T9SS type B sorting domain-containing protein n=1 Tax=Chitinophaga sp. RCC_12 TaxID=3239226 RepID=UPI0035268A67
MLRVARICLVFLLLPVIVHAQKEINIWYFGYNAGLNFNTTPATVLTDGRTYTREGVATICDGATGKLLFYTEGSTVWNAQHGIMPNGTGLMGDPSSVQSGIAVPFPGHPGQYYLFTTMTNKGFRYNILDMALDNGKGDIIPSTKNTALLSNSQSTEKMAATRHCNGRDYWIVTHSANGATFHVYLLSPAGLSAATTYTTGAVIHPGGWEETGHIKFSPDGGIIVHSLGSIRQGAMSVVDLLKFNNSTGVISPPFASLNIIFPLGIEFTISGKLLYVVSMNYLNWGKLYQYDLTAPDINASQQTIVTNTDDIQMGGLQMGPDGHIYMGYEQGYYGGYRYVGMIHNPEVRGVGCNFERDAIDMEPPGTGQHRTSVSFPTFVNSFLYFPADFTASDLCTPSPLFKLNNEVGVTSILWDFGDGTTSVELSPRHTYAIEKKYTVKVKVTRRCSTDEKIQDIILGSKTEESVTKSICSNDTYTLPDGREVSTAGVYVSTLKRLSNGCDSIINTTLKILPVYQLTEKVTICSGQEYQLPDGRKVNSSGSYTSSLKTYQGCDSITTTVVYVPEKNYPQDAVICEGDNYRLPDGKVVTVAGIYNSILMSSAGCDSIIITTLVVNPVYAAAESISICDGDTYRLPDGRTVSVTGQYTSRFKSDKGCDSLIVTNLQMLPRYNIAKTAITCEGEPYMLPDGRSVRVSGTYVSSFASYHGCDSIITTRLTVMPVYSQEKYDTICNGQFYTLPDGRSVSSAGRYVSALFTTSGCDSTVIVYLALKEKPQVTLVPEVCLFSGRPTVITLVPGYDKYEWQNGFSGNVYAIRYPGIYRVAVSNECGVVNLQTLVKECASDLYVPNAFTPNGDGLNDVFRLRQPNGQVLLEFRVFDRWGVEIFSTTNLLQGWDGTYKGQLQPVGAYVYFIRYKNIDGIEKQLKGAVNLLL